MEAELNCKNYLIEKIKQKLAGEVRRELTVLRRTIATLIIPRLTNNPS